MMYLLKKDADGYGIFVRVSHPGKMWCLCNVYHKIVFQNKLKQNFFGKNCEKNMNGYGGRQCCFVNKPMKKIPACSQAYMTQKEQAIGSAPFMRNTLFRSLR